MIGLISMIHTPLGSVDAVRPEDGGLILMTLTSTIAGLLVDLHQLTPATYSCRSRSLLEGA
jgi:hypothetical protein